jgi:phosphohistidine phosphatase
MMDLILWRHAEAEVGSPELPDIERALTRKGRKQAARMARWLKSTLPRDAIILVSPARRTQQTAQALGMRYRTRDELAPGKSVEDILAAAGWPAGNGAVVIVGHNPALGEAGALLLINKPAEWTLKKAGVWWFSNCGAEVEGQAVLEAAMSPRVLKMKKR